VKRPNFLVIMLDTLRPDYLGCGGSSWVKTPHMDALAARGLFFSRAYAEYPVTVPSRTALVSGSYTWTNRPWCPLRSYDLHIAEVLKGAGYETACFSDSPMNAGAGLDRGFDTFVFFPEGKCHGHPDAEVDVDISDAYFPPHAEAERRFYYNTLVGRELARRKYGMACPELLFDQALAWLRARRGTGPFFLWIDSFEPHEPWAPPQPYYQMYGADRHERYIPMPPGPAIDWMGPGDLEQVRALYAGDVTHTDEMVGRVMETLEALGLMEDTLIAVISDHGSPLGEHGTIRKFGIPLYEELARMAWLMALPGVVPQGRASDALVQNVDLAPTLAELAGLAWEPEAPLRSIAGGPPPEDIAGRSLVPLLRGEVEEVRSAAYVGAFNLHASIVTADGYKFIDNRGEKPNELYHLSQDPAEQENLAQREPDLAAELHRKLWEFQAQWSAALAWRDEPARP